MSSMFERLRAHLDWASFITYNLNSILITHFSNSIFSFNQIKTRLVSFLALCNSKFCNNGGTHLLCWVKRIVAYPHKFSLLFFFLPSPFFHSPNPPILSPTLLKSEGTKKWERIWYVFEFSSPQQSNPYATNSKQTRNDPQELKICFQSLSLPKPAAFHSPLQSGFPQVGTLFSLSLF